MTNNEVSGKGFCKKDIILIAIVIIIGASIGISLYLFFTSSQIAFAPQKLDVSLSPGENFTKTISIRAIGIGTINVTLNANEPIDKWVHFSNKGKKSESVEVPIEVGKTSYVNVKLDIPQNTTPGEYKCAIEITHNSAKAEIPVLIKIQQTLVQIVGIEAPLKVNKSEHFNITAKIKNVGNFDALGVTASINLTSGQGLELAEGELESEKIGIIPKNEIVSAIWWFKANQTAWKSIKVNLESKNAGKDTEMIIVKII